MLRFHNCWKSIVLLASLVSFTVTGWSSERLSDVEFVPTPQPVVEAMLRMAGANQSDLVYDLGCGDGRIVITAARQFGARGLGVDIDPFYVGLSRKKALAAGVTDRVSFVEGDFFKTDLRKATIVSLYLTPELNLRLRPKLFSELAPGARVISHDFNMGDWRPDDMGRLPNIRYEYPDWTYNRNAPFYLWIIPANVAGKWHWSLGKEEGRQEYTLSFVQKFQKITGNLSVDNQTFPISNARLRGDKLSFTAVVKQGGKEEVLMWFVGRINGHTIEGSLEIPTGAMAGSYDWRAGRDL